MNGGEIKLMSRKVFIGGPISHLMRENGFDESFIGMHKMVIKRFEQLGYQTLSAHIVEGYGKNKIDPDDLIVNRDLNWIDEADVCIFLLPSEDDHSIRTDGTYIELGYASSKCRDIYCFWDSANAHFYSPMFRGMFDRNVKLYDISRIREVLESFE